MQKSKLSEKVKELRKKKGISQEALAEESGLSLRTIQRIENGETVPRGDTLQRLAEALNVTPDELLDWELEENPTYLTMMSLSALSFLLFPLLGVIIPLVLWVFKKEKIKKVDELGVAMLNFQMSWVFLLFLFNTITSLFITSGFSYKTGLLFNWSFWQTSFSITTIFYAFNVIIVILNTININRGKPISYKPSFNILK